jgi:DNA-binding response OmpR family regulator
MEVLRAIVVSCDRGLGSLLAQALDVSGFQVILAASTAADAARELGAGDGIALAVLDWEAAGDLLGEAVRLETASTIVIGSPRTDPDEIARLLLRFDAYVAADDAELLASLVARLARASYARASDATGR